MTLDDTTYTVYRTADLDGPAQPVEGVLVVRTEDITDADHTPVGQLLGLLDEGLGYSVEQLRRAIRWNRDLSGSCRTILNSEQALRNQANAIIEDLEHDLNQLRNQVLQVVRSGGGQTMELLRRLVDPAGEEHDCPDCECWMYKPREVEE